MSNKIIAGVVLLLALVIMTSAYAQQSDTPTEPTVTTSTVHRFADASEVDNAFARLTRYDNGVTAVFSTNDLKAGDVYTVWWVIFNAPENCTDGVCNEDDIFMIENGGVPRDDAGNRVMNMENIANANISVQHASGAYSADGSLNVSASLGEGLVPGIVFGPGLLDAQTAEIHMVVRTHGLKVDNIFADQISTFGGGCEPMDAAPCDDVQFAMFKPVSG